MEHFDNKQLKVLYLDLIIKKDKLSVFNVSQFK